MFAEIKRVFVELYRQCPCWAETVNFSACWQLITPLCNVVIAAVVQCKLGNANPGGIFQTRVYGFDGLQTRVPGFDYVSPVASR